MELLVAEELITIGVCDYMGRCGNCRWFNANFCEWWLKSVTATTRRTTCFVPLDSDPQYPLYPTPKEADPRRFDYPEPHGHCLVCGAELSGRQRKYCSSGHRKMYYARFTWTSVRFLVWQRDQQCCRCGTPLSPSEAECDHIMAVALGGGYWDYNNLQTLCRTCHAQKTREDRAKINHIKNRSDKAAGRVIGSITKSTTSPYRKKLKYMIGKKPRY